MIRSVVGGFCPGSGAGAAVLVYGGGLPYSVAACPRMNAVHLLFAFQLGLSTRVRN